MTGATVITALGIGVAPALFPLTVGLLAASVMYGRLRLAPISSRPSRSTGGGALRTVVERPEA